MCGIVGMLGTIGHNQDKMLRDMLIFDTVRGEHSTGAAFIQGTGNTKVFKKACNPFEFFQYQQFTNAKNLVNRAIIGHNRYATAGKVNNENAHPFECGNIIGVHNGTLTNKYKLDDSQYFEVDSENLFHHMDKNGVDDTIALIEGAYALNWYDKEAHTINFIRNGDRPLFIATAVTGDNVYWASEAWMLTVAASRRSININNPELIGVGKLISFHVPDAANKCVDHKPHIRSLKVYEKPITQAANKHKSSRPATKGLTSKVTPIDAKKQLAVASKGLSTGYSALVNTTIEMVINGSDVVGGNEYVTADVADDRRLKLRIHTGNNKTLRDQLVNSKCNWFGKVKRANHKFGGYITISLHTLAEIEEAEIVEKEPVPVYNGYRGTELTAQEFTTATEDGCAMCQMPAFLNSAGDIKWIHTAAFLCSECSEDDDLMGFYNQGWMN